jgi:copper chaperone CopZ
MNFFSKKSAPAERHLKIEGMNCGACQSHVTKALQGVAGVKSVSVDLGKGEASVSGSADNAALIQAVEKAGYKAANL